MSTSTSNEVTDRAATSVVWPVFRYTDARAAIKFLVDAFGFEETAVYGEGDVVDHAELKWPGGGGVMVSTHREGGPLNQMPAGTGAAYLVVDNPDALYERAVAAGASVAAGLRDEDYGSRGFTCRDPEGVYWSFGTYAGAQ